MNVPVKKEKEKKRNKVKMVNQQKLKIKIIFPTTLTLLTSQPHYPTFLTKNRKKGYLPTVPIFFLKKNYQQFQ